MKKIGTISTYLAAAIQFVFGVVYAVRNEFMPYHADAAGMEWSEVGEPFQILFIAGLKIAASGFFISAITIAFLQWQYQRQYIKWIPGLILFIGTVSFAGIMAAILIVKLNTPADPPLFLATIAWILIIFGFLSRQRNPDEPHI